MIADVIICRRRATIGEVSPLIAAVLSTETTDLVLSLPEEPSVDLPPWIEVPRVLHATSNSMPTYIEFFTEESRLTFYLRPDWANDHVHVLQHISALLRRPIPTIRLYGGDGWPWVFPHSAATSQTVTITFERGGMQPSSRASRSRSVSRTLPFSASQSAEMQQEADQEPGQMQDVQPQQEVDQLRDNVPQDDASSGISARTYPSPDSVTSNHRPQFWAQVWPDTPPPAQPRMHSRDIIAGGEVYGTILAPRRARVSEVLMVAERTIRPREYLYTYPSDVEFWEPVQYIIAPRANVIGEDNTIDLRRPPWEGLQRERRVPLINARGFVCNVILPQHVNFRTAQARLNRRAPWHQTWALTCFGDIWWIIAFSLPHDVIDAAEDWFQDEDWNEQDENEEEEPYVQDETYFEDGQQRGAGRGEERQECIQFEKKEHFSIQRGAGKRSHKDPETSPKQAMAIWAQQRVMECYPEVSPQTIAMLIRAEPKLASSVIYSKSEQQVRHSIQAAYRRAGLCPPTGQRPETTEESGGPSSSTQPAQQPLQVTAAMTHMHDMTESLRNQTTILASLHESVSYLPGVQYLDSMNASFNAQQQAQAIALRDFAGVVQRLEDRFNLWEQQILPEILARLPHGAPATPMETEDAAVQVQQDQQDNEEPQAQAGPVEE